MKKEDLFKAIGEADDRFIELAELPKDSKELKKERSLNIASLRGNREGSAGAKMRGFNGSAASKMCGFKRYVPAMAAALAVCILVAGPGRMLFSAKGASAPMDTESADLYANEVNNDFASKPGSYGYTADLPANESLEPEKLQNASASDAALKNAKLVYKAYLSLQTTDFDATIDSIKKLTGDFGGYFESSVISNGSYYSDGTYKRGEYVVRVPSDKYRDFIDGISEGCHVVDISETMDDIGTQYYDAESHLATLKIKEERLQDLLKKATNMSDIIELESALSENEYLMQMYSSELERYDSLVDYATVSFDVQQVSKFSGSATERESFGSRLGRNLVNGARNFIEGVEDFILWLGYNIIGLALAVAVILAVRHFHLIARFCNLFRRKKE